MYECGRKHITEELRGREVLFGPPAMPYMKAITQPHQTITFLSLKWAEMITVCQAQFCALANIIMIIVLLIYLFIY